MTVLRNPIVPHMCTGQWTDSFASQLADSPADTSPCGAERLPPRTQHSLLGGQQQKGAARPEGVRLHILQKRPPGLQAKHSCGQLCLHTS